MIGCLTETTTCVVAKPLVSIKEQQPLMLVDIFKTVQTNTRLNGGKKNCSQFCIHKNVSGQLNLQNVFINFHQACTKPYS